MMTELNSIKMTRDMAKMMFPEHVKISEKFDKELQALIEKTLEDNDKHTAFSVITAEMTMSLCRLFAATRTDPQSVIKAYANVLETVYREMWNIKDDKKKDK